MNSLQEALYSYIAPYLEMPSRVHHLSSFHTASVFVKREDELGGLFNGTKRRKYRSLVPHLLQKRIWIAIGSIYSNHILAITELGKRNKKRLLLVLSRPHEDKKRGNRFLTELFLKEEEILWVDSHENEDLLNVALKQQHLFESEGYKVALIPLGGDTPYALAGALTLSYEILNQEKELSLDFSHIFIDAGTGFTASSLALGHAILKPSTKIHVVSLAEKEASLILKLKELHGELEKALGRACPLLLPNYYQPMTARSFGSVNQTVMRYIQKIAQNEGILLDPLYNAKLFMKAESLIQKESLKGDILLIHSGGLTSLLGFVDA